MRIITSVSALHSKIISKLCCAEMFCFGTNKELEQGIVCISYTVKITESELEMILCTEIEMKYL